MVWTDHGEDTRAVLDNHPKLSRGQVEAAIHYVDAHGDEMPRGFWGGKPPSAREVRV